MSLFLTDLGNGKSIYQDDEGYCFSQDSVLLANLATMGAKDTVLDLGSGCGVLSFLAVLKKGVRSACGIECQSQMVDMANKSAHLLGVDDKVTFLHADVKDICTHLGAGSFDKVVCNPPYFTSGEQSPCPTKRSARHESNATLEVFVCAANYALKFGGDAFWVVNSERLCTLISLLKQHRLEPKRLVMIYPKLSSGVHNVIVCARKGAKEGVDIDTLICMSEDGTYTAQFENLYK